MADRATEGAGRLTEAFGETYQQVVRAAMDNQQRNVQLAQGWVEGLTGVLESQAETNRALTRAMESYTQVVEETIKSQERTGRALAESLESYKEVIERSTEMQDRSARLVETFFGGVTGDLRTQAQGSQEIVKVLMDGSERQMNAFQQMLDEAMTSYTDLMSAPLALYQKNLEAMGLKPPGDTK